MESGVRATFTEVADALTELGLSYERLREAVMAGEYARDTCTPNDPPNASGIIAWMRTTRALRELYAPDGWERNDDANFSTVVSPDESIAIAVMSGDESTGKPPPAIPKTKHTKGPKTAAAVLKNRSQLHLFNQELNRQIIDGVGPNETQTWILLRSRVEDTVYWELSLPEAIGEDDRVERWTVRILFEPIGLEPTPLPDQGDDGEEVEVQVHRR